VIAGLSKDVAKNIYLVTRERFGNKTWMQLATLNIQQRILSRKAYFFSPPNDIIRMPFFPILGAREIFLPIK